MPNTVSQSWIREKASDLPLTSKKYIYIYFMYFVMGTISKFIAT